MKVFSNKIIVTLVTQGLPSSFLRPLLLRKFTNIDSSPQIFEESPSHHDNNSQVIPSSEYNRYASGIISLYP